MNADDRVLARRRAIAEEAQIPQLTLEASRETNRLLTEILERMDKTFDVYEDKN